VFDYWKATETHSSANYNISYTNGSDSNNGGTADPLKTVQFSTGLASSMNALLVNDGVHYVTADAT
jgi:hypothetical protein